MRTRQIKQYGNTFVIKLSPDDLKDLNLEVGNYVDIDDITKINFKPLPKNQTKEEIKNKINKKELK